MSSPTIISLTQLYYYLAFLTRPEYSEHILIQNPFSGCLCLGFSFQNICMIFSITFWGYLLKGYLMTESFSDHPVFPTSLYHALLKKKKKKIYSRKCICYHWNLPLIVCLSQQYSKLHRKRVWWFLPVFPALGMLSGMLLMVNKHFLNEPDEWLGVMQRVLGDPGMWHKPRGIGLSENDSLSR